MTVLGSLFDVVTVAVTTTELVMIDMSGVFRTVLDETTIAGFDRIADDVEETDVESGVIGDAGAMIEDSSGCADTELGKIA